MINNLLQNKIIHKFSEMIINLTIHYHFLEENPFYKILQQLIHVQINLLILLISFMVKLKVGMKIKVLL